jgi:hypothetical protein
MLDVAGCAARFFLQLSQGAIVRRFPRVEPACGYLVEVAFGCISILTYQKHVGIRACRVAEKGNDGARARMPDHLELTDRPIGKTHRVDVE